MEVSKNIKFNQLKKEFVYCKLVKWFNFSIQIIVNILIMKISRIRNKNQKFYISPIYSSFSNIPSIFFAVHVLFFIHSHQMIFKKYNYNLFLSLSSLNLMILLQIHKYGLKQQFNRCIEKFKNLMITAKINLLYSQRKNTAIQSHMSKIRSNFINQRKKQAIYAIIEASSFSINSHHLALLFDFANKGQEEAIIHLGNLLIDNLISVQEFQKYEFRPSASPYSIWLLRVLHEKRFFTRQYLDYLFEFVESFHGPFLDQHAFPLLAQILKQKTEIIAILLNDHEKSLKKICKYCQEGNPKRAKNCYSILSAIISDSSQSVKKLISIIEFDDVVKLLDDGLARVEVEIRALCCQMIANIVIDFEIPLQLFEKLLTLSQKEKQKVIIEISYIFYNFVFYSEKGTIIKILHMGLIPVLGKMTESMHESIRKNISKTVSHILQMMETFDELDRMFTMRQLTEEDQLGRILEEEDMDIERSYF